MKIIQKEIQLKEKSRGFHLITEEVENNLTEIKEIRQGVLKVFIKHTSAGLTINENADPTVRHDFEEHFNRMVPENAPYYQHTYEGADDMPAHIKASLMGPSIQIPVSEGSFAFGTWQGIYLCEHRNFGGPRKVVVTIWGE